MEEMTVIEALEHVANHLMSIPIPVGMAEQIAYPMFMDAKTIMDCVKVLKEGSEENVSGGQGNQCCDSAQG